MNIYLYILLAIVWVVSGIITWRLITREIIASCGWTLFSVETFELLFFIMAGLLGAFISGIICFPEIKWPKIYLLKPESMKNQEKDII